MIPPKLAARIPTIRETRALRYVAGWLESDLEFGVLVGDTGAGKSLAAAWAHAWQDYRAPVDGMGRRRSAVWWDARALAALSPWAGEQRGPRRPEEPITGWAAYDLASLVVIDDAGTEDDPARIAAAIERAINVSEARLLITTNLERDAFLQRYGARVASRLSDARGWFVSAAPDMRKTSPTTAPFRGPRDPTPRERQAAAAREAERVAEMEEWERTQSEREEMAERYERLLRETTRAKTEEQGE